MIIELAQGKDKQKIAKLDSHIPSPRLGECIWNGQVYVLKDDSIKNGGQNPSPSTLELKNATENATTPPEGQ